MIITTQFLSLFAAIWMTSINIVLVVRNKGIPVMNLLIMSAGWTFFILATWFI